MSARYQLGPILRHMRACGEARSWLLRQGHGTFTEAFGALVALGQEADRAGASPLWVSWLVGHNGLSVPWDKAGNLCPCCMEGGRTNYAAALAAKGITAATVEAALVEYARKNSCLVEVGQ